MLNGGVSGPHAALAADAGERSAGAAIERGASVAHAASVARDRTSGTIVARRIGSTPSEGCGDVGPPSGVGRSHRAVPLACSERIGTFAAGGVDERRRRP